MRRSLFWLLDHYPEVGESLASMQTTALEQAELADSLGFESLWLAEHHFQKLGTIANPAVLLAAIAQRTKNMRLGTAVAVLPLRNPVNVAEDYAMVDVLSGGRLNMGVGAGSRPHEFAGLGCDFDERKKTFTKNLALMREHWAASYAQATGPAALNVAPIQTPAPPIYVATTQVTTAHEVGLRGDSLLTLVSPLAAGLDEVKQLIAAHARGLADAGHDAQSAESVVMAFAHVAESEEGARAVAGPAMSRFIEALAGARPAESEKIYEMMRGRGTGLFGTATQVEEQIERYSEMGVGHLAFISRFGGMPVEAAQQSLRRLAAAP